MSQQIAVYYDADGNEVDVNDILAEHSEGAFKNLREQYKTASKDAKRVPELEEKLARYEKGDALKAAGLDGLTDKQRKALEAAHDGEWTADALRATAIELNLATRTEQEQQLEQDLEAQGRIAEAAAGGGAGNAGVITPADVAVWPTDKTIRFKQQHPQEFELLKRGEEVVGLTFN